MRPGTGLYASDDQLRPELTLITDMSTFGSRPMRMPSVNASDVPIMQMAASRADANITHTLVQLFEHAVACVREMLVVPAGENNFKCT